MTAAFPVRRLLIDLESPFERRWNGGDAFRSALFDALSMSFPAGEQFFIDAVRAGVKTLPANRRAQFEPEIQSFVGQEATHRRIHALFNGELARQGHVNRWQAHIERRRERLEGADLRHRVAITAATEHFTALFAEHLLAFPALLEGAEPRLRTLWLWHASEESEHRSVAFDLYRELGGDERWRRRWMRSVTFFFVTDLMRQTLRNLWHDGALLKATTWQSAARTLFGRNGLVRHTRAGWRAYFRPDFHPSQHGGERGAQWLRDNAEQFTALEAVA